MEQPKPTSGFSGMEAMGFVWDVFFAIAIPTTLFAYGGRWLDRALNSSPWFLVIGLLLSLAVAYLLIMRKAKTYLAIMKEASREHRMKAVSQEQKPPSDENPIA